MEWNVSWCLSGGGSWSYNIFLYSSTCTYGDEWPLSCILWQITGTYMCHSAVFGEVLSFRIYLFIPENVPMERNWVDDEYMTHYLNFNTFSWRRHPRSVSILLFCLIVYKITAEQCFSLVFCIACLPCLPKDVHPIRSLRSLRLRMLSVTDTLKVVQLRLPKVSNPRGLKNPLGNLKQRKFSKYNLQCIYIY